VTQRERFVETIITSWDMLLPALFERNKGWQEEKERKTIPSRGGNGTGGSEGGGRSHIIQCGCRGAAPATEMSATDGMSGRRKAGEGISIEQSQLSYGQNAPKQNDERKGPQPSKIRVKTPANIFHAEKIKRQSRQKLGGKTGLPGCREIRDG